MILLRGYFIHNGHNSDFIDYKLVVTNRLKLEEHNFMIREKHKIKSRNDIAMVFTEVETKQK